MLKLQLVHGKAQGVDVVHISAAPNVLAPLLDRAFAYWFVKTVTGSVYIPQVKGQALLDIRLPEDATFSWEEKLGKGGLGSYPVRLKYSQSGPCVLCEYYLWFSQDRPCRDQDLQRLLEIAAMSELGQAAPDYRVLVQAIEKRCDR